MKDRGTVIGEFFGWFIGNKFANSLYDRCKVLVVDKIGLGPSVLSRDSRNADEEKHIFVEVVLTSGLFDENELHLIEDFMKRLHDEDRADSGDRLAQFIHFVAAGTHRLFAPEAIDENTVQSEMQIEIKKGTLEFLKRLLSKHTNDERIVYCETYGVWPNAGIMSKLKERITNDSQKTEAAVRETIDRFNKTASEFRAKQRYKGFWREVFGLPPRKDNND